jgi:hypothetical protein
LFISASHLESDTILKGKYARTIPAKIWSNLVQWLQRSLNVKAYDVSRTNDGHQVMAEDFMAFGHVS